MQGLIVITTLIALVASFVVISTRQTKPRPRPQPHTKRQLRRLQHQRRRYYQRRMRIQQQQHLVLLAFVVQWQYRQLLSEATA